MNKTITNMEDCSIPVFECQNAATLTACWENGSIFLVVHHTWRIESLVLTD